MNIKESYFSNKKQHIIFLLMFLFLCSLSHITLAENKLSVINLSFGVYQSDKATVMYRKFLPLLELLQEKMEVKLGQPVDIELKIFKGYAQAIDELVNGGVDFVRFGPASYAIAKERNNDIQLIAMEQKKGKKRFNGLIVGRADSPIKNLKQLKDHSFAFGNNKSTIGRYLAQAELFKAGVHAKDLSNYEFLGRHDKVFKAVELGDYDAGALKESTFKSLNKNGKLRVIATFENVTKPWIARKGLSSRITMAISEGLISIKDKAILKIFKASGFLATNDEEYAFVREGMKLSGKFDK